VAGVEPTNSHCPPPSVVRTDCISFYSSRLPQNSTSPSPYLRRLRAFSQIQAIEGLAETTLFASGKYGIGPNLLACNNGFLVTGLRTNVV